MIEIARGREIGQIRNARRGLEVDVAKTIVRELFQRDKPYFTRLTKHILRLINDTADTMGHGRMNALLQDQRSYMMWNECSTQPTVFGLRKVGHYLAGGGGNATKWLCICSDLIRLVGELSEKTEIVASPWGRPSMHRNWTTLAQGKDKLRPEPVYAKPTVYERGQGPAVKKRSPDGWGHRDRYDHLAPIEQDAPFVDIPRERVQWRGVERFEFGDDSTISVLDYTFGLAEEGADVSGTTTDSIATLRWAAGGGGVSSRLQLIAIATMVIQGHHTIAECAWPLTRNGYMDYEIGFYETLLPSKKESGQLYGKLVKWNDDARNRHVLVFKEGGADVCFQFTRRDNLDEYRRLYGIRKAYGFSVGGRTDREGIENYIVSNRVEPVWEENL